MPLALSFIKVIPVKKYVDKCYKKEAYEVTYQPLIYLTNGSNLWPPIDYSIIQPTMIRKVLGIPNKLRRREVDEPRKRSFIDKRNISIKCNRCK